MTPGGAIASLFLITMGIFGTLLLLFPSQMVRWQAQWYKFLWEHILRVDDQRIPQKSRAAILKGIETPEECTFNMRAYRFLAGFFFLTAVVGLLVIVLSLLAN